MRMNFLIGILLSLISIFTPSVTKIASSNITTNNSLFAINDTNNVIDGFNVMNFNGHKHYLGLSDATNFAITDTSLYYSTNTSVYQYLFETEETTKLSDFSDIESITYANNTLFAFKSKSLYKLSSGTFNKYIDCDMYSFYTKDTTTYLTIINGNTFKTISMNGETEVVMWDTTVPSTYTPVSVANNDSMAFLLAKQNGSTKILEMNFKSRTTTPYTYDFDINNIYYWCTSNGNSILVYYTDGDLSTIEKQTDSDNYIDIYTKKLYNHGEHGFEIGKFYKIKDCYIFNSELYILDNIYSAIQKFEYSTDIKFTDLVTSSSAYTDGKFYNPNSFNIIDKNNFVVADTYNKAIQVINNSTATLVKNYTSNTTKVNFEYVTRVIKTTSNYYVLQHDELDNFEILILDLDFNLIENITHSLSNIVDIELVNNDLYILDEDTSKLYRYTNNVLEDSNANITVNSNSKLNYIIESNKLAIFYDTKIYFLDIQTKSISQYDNNETIYAVSNDFMGNAYVLSDSKISRLDTSDVINSTANITISKKYSHMAIEKETGYIYLYNSKNQCFEILKSNKVYTLSNEYTHPVDISTYSAEAPITIATTNDNVFVYTHPYNTGVSYDISNNQIYILGEVNNYWYIAYKYSSLDKYSTLGLGYISKDCAVINSYSTLGLAEKFEVLTNTKVYRIPTMLQYNNSSLILAELEKGQNISSKYELLSGSTYTIDGCDYYIITINDKIGYVKKVDVVSTKANHTEEILKPNAKLIVSEDKYNGVYVYAGNSSIVIDKLLVDKEIYVETYDINYKYTYIKYLDENNREHGGYVLTKCIKMNDSKDTNIGAIILIVLTVVAIAGISTFYIISYKKQQKSLTETKEKFDK